MYNLKLSAEEISTIRCALVMARTQYLQNPVFFEDEVTEITNVLEKVRHTQYTIEEG